MIDPRIYIIAGIFVAGVLAGLGLAHWHYAPRLEAAELKVEALSADISHQNDAIEDLREAGDKRAEKAAKKLAEAQAGRARAEADAQNILLMQPQPGEDRCTAASRVIRQELAP